MKNPKLVPAPDASIANQDPACCDEQSEFENRSHPAYRQDLGKYYNEDSRTHFCNCNSCAKARLMRLHRGIYTTCAEDFPNWDFDKKCPRVGLYESKVIELAAALIPKTTLAPPGGMSCHSCNVLNPDAGPNRPNGTYLCYECRH